MGVRFTPARDGLRQLAASREVGSHMATVARAGGAYAESIAPVDKGDYQRGFRVRQTSVAVPGIGRVAGAVLENIDPAAPFVEWKNNDHVLARSAAWMEQQT